MATETKEKDVVEERRFFEYIIDVEPEKFYLGMPTSEQIRQAEWHYSKVYNKALVEGVATTAEMMDILTKRNLYGPEYETRLQELQTSIVLKVAEMHSTLEDGPKEKAALEVTELRDELYRWNQRITGPLSNSCEQMAEDAKTEYITSVVVQDEKGDPIWDSHEAFVTEKDQGLALKSRYEVLLWLQGLDADFLDKTPENQVLRDLALQKEEAEADALLEPPQLEAPKEEKKPPKKKRASRRKKTQKKNPAKTV